MKNLKDALSFWRAIRVATFAVACTCGLHAQAQSPASPTDASLSSTNPEDQVKLSAKGSFLTDHAAVGDTVNYLLSVEWNDSRVPVVVLAPESLEATGFHIADQSTTHRKSAGNGEIRNATEFQYKLVAKMPGGAKVSALKLRYLTGFSNREEALYVPGVFLDIEPARIPFWKQLWFKLIALIAAAASMTWGVRRGLQKARSRRKQAQMKNQRDFAPEVKTLKGRWNTTESRVWIDDAERVCMEYLRHNLGSNIPDNARFEALLEQYLTRHSDAGEAEGWKRLRELFRHARYAGGRKEPHELQDTYRTLITCLHIQGDNE